MQADVGGGGRGSQNRQRGRRTNAGGTNRGSRPPSASLDWPYLLPPPNYPPQSSAVVNEIVQNMYDDIKHKPDYFGGRFTVACDDGELFHLHYAVIKPYSPKMKQWIEGNDAICDGRPLSVAFGSEVVQAVVDLMYLNKLSGWCVELLPQMVELIDQWLMQKMADRIVQFASTQIPLRGIEDFELLLRLFVTVSKCAIIDGTALHRLILQQLKTLAGSDTENRAVVKEQLREFWKAYEDDAFEMVLDILED